MRGQPILYYQVTKDRGQPPTLDGITDLPEVSASALHQRVAAVHHHLHTFPGIVQLWEPRPRYSYKMAHDLDRRILEMQRIGDLIWATGALAPPRAFRNFMRESGWSDKLYLRPLLQQWSECVEVYGEARGMLIDTDGQACDLETGTLSLFPERYYADLLGGKATVPDTWWDQQALARLRDLFTAWDQGTWDIEQTKTLAAGLYDACRDTVTDGAQWARLRVQADYLGDRGPEVEEELLSQPTWPHRRRRRARPIDRENRFGTLMEAWDALKDDPAAYRRVERAVHGEYYDYHPVPLTVVCGWFGLCCLELSRDIERQLSPGRCPRCNEVTWLKVRQHRDRLCDRCRAERRRELNRQGQQRYRRRQQGWRNTET